MNNKKFLTSIFLTAFIDMLGVGILIPIIPDIFLSANHLHFSGLNSPSEYKWAYCLLMASFSMMVFVGAPILGTLSDRYGRKKIIQSSLLGQVIGYAFFALALKTENIYLLFGSRLFAGFFAGSLSVLFSAISDISTQEDKPKNFGLVGMAFGLGFVLGPALGVILSLEKYCSLFTIYTPFIFTSCLALGNFFFVNRTFVETCQSFQQQPITFLKGVQNIYKAFTSNHLKLLFSISFFNTLGFAFFTQFFSVFMIQKFQTNREVNGYIFLWVGIWIVITQGVILRRISGKISPSSIINKTMLTMGLGIIAMVFPNQIWGILICNLVVAISQGLNSPNLLTLVSRTALPEEQGEILGINQSMQALGNIIPPLIVGFFGENLQSFPIIAAGGFIIIAWAIFVLFYRPSELSK